MTAKKQILRKILLLYLLGNLAVLFSDCTKKLDPDPLQFSVRQNLAMLQPDAQFVMYFNFRKMRETGFWGKFINDSLISAEQGFGNFLAVLKKATGAGISNGIDELYYSNSWIGDNAMVIKGTFERKKVEEYLKSDSLYSSRAYPPNITVYKQKEVNLYFFFKDDFTVCASNYMRIIENDIAVTDTSQTGLLSNADAIKVIENIKYKENLWMMSDQKLFIRGIFENFADTKSKPPQDLGVSPDSTLKDDSSKTNTGIDIASMYKKINAVSFSLKMTNELNIVMQNEFDDNKSATELKNKLEAVVALVKLSSSFSKKKPTALIRTLDKMELNVFDKTTVAQVKLSESDVTEIRKQKIF